MGNFVEYVKKLTLLQIFVRSMEILLRVQFGSSQRSNCAMGQSTVAP